MELMNPHCVWANFGWVSVAYNQMGPVQYTWWLLGLWRLCRIGTFNLSVSPPHGCSYVHSSQFDPTNMLRGGVGPHLEWFGSGPASFQWLSVVALVLQGQKHFGSASKPLGLNLSPVSQWKSDLGQVMDLCDATACFMGLCWWMGSSGPRAFHVMGSADLHFLCAVPPKSTWCLFGTQASVIW